MVHVSNATRVPFQVLATSKYNLPFCIFSHHFVFLIHLKDIRSLINAAKTHYVNCKCHWFVDLWLKNDRYFLFMQIIAFLFWVIGVKMKNTEHQLLWLPKMDFKMNGGLFQRSGLSFYEKNCFSTENKLISCLLNIVFLFAGY